MDHVDRFYHGLNNSFCMCLTIVKLYLLLGPAQALWKYVTGYIFLKIKVKKKYTNLLHFSNDMPTRGAISVFIFFHLQMQDQCNDIKTCLFLLAV